MLKILSCDHTSFWIELWSTYVYVWTHTIVTKTWICNRTAQEKTAGLYAGDYVSSEKGLYLSERCRCTIYICWTLVVNTFSFKSFCVLLSPLNLIKGKKSCSWEEQSSYHDPVPFSASNWTWWWTTVRGTWWWRWTDSWTKKMYLSVTDKFNS